MFHVLPPGFLPPATLLQVAIAPLVSELPLLPPPPLLVPMLSLPPPPLLVPMLPLLLLLLLLLLGVWVGVLVAAFFSFLHFTKKPN